MLNLQKQKRVIETAFALFPNNFENKSFHVTFVYWGRKLISIAENKCTTHTINLKYPYVDRQTHVHVGDQIGLHSEAAAIIKLGKIDCSRFTFVNIRINKERKIAIAKPCNGCQSLLSQVGYKDIYFTNNEGSFEKF